MHADVIMGSVLILILQTCLAVMRKGNKNDYRRHHQNTFQIGNKLTYYGMELFGVLLFSSNSRITCAEFVHATDRMELGETGSSLSHHYNSFF